jgi:hypothetical protein
MKIKNWIACVQDRGKWKEVIEKAKTFNYEVQRLEEEEVQGNEIFKICFLSFVDELPLYLRPELPPPPPSPSPEFL